MYHKMGSAHLEKKQCIDIAAHFNVDGDNHVDAITVSLAFGASPMLINASQSHSITVTCSFE